MQCEKLRKVNMKWKILLIDPKLAIKKKIPNCDTLELSNVHWGWQGCRARAEVAIRLTMAGKVYSQHPREVKCLISSHSPPASGKMRVRAKYAYGLFNVNITSSNSFSPTLIFFSLQTKTKTKKKQRKKSSNSISNSKQNREENFFLQSGTKKFPVSYFYSHRFGVNHLECILFPKVVPFISIGDENYRKISKKTKSAKNPTRN